MSAIAASAAGTVAWSSVKVSHCRVISTAHASSHGEHLHLARRQPADAHDLIEFLLIVDSHWLIVVFPNDLPLSAGRYGGKPALSQLTWSKSVLNLRLSRSEYLSNSVVRSVLSSVTLYA